MSSLCHDSSILDQWHPLGAVDGIEPNVVGETMLLGEQIRYVLDDAGAVEVNNSASNSLPTILRYGYVWTSLGSPPDGLFEIPEFAEPDRRNLHAASFGIHCSAPRSVENFLDMGHFPFVHTNYLGEEPHTEVLEYEVDVDPDTNDIWATKCEFWQPRAAASAEGGQMVDYVYRVPHPYCTLLYKSCPTDASRMDIVGLFNQPVAADRINGHMLLSYIEDAAQRSRGPSNSRRNSLAGH